MIFYKKKNKRCKMIYYIYIIIFNESCDKNNKKLSRYSILLNKDNIPLIKITNNNVCRNKLAKYYLQNFIELDYNPIKEVKIFKKYKNIEYLFIYTNNFIHKEINSKYVWKHYLHLTNLIDKQSSQRLCCDIDFDLNTNKIYDFCEVNFKTIVNWLYSHK